MSEQMPELIDPLVMVEKRRQFNGSLPVSQMPQMQDVLHNVEGSVRFSLRFGKEGSVAAVTGVVEADLVLQCQCCLGPIAWPISSRVNLGIVSTVDEADRLPDSFEPLLLEGESIALADIIQEELLLAIPPIPQHEHCEASAANARAETSAAPKRPNPFAALAELKKK